MEHAGPVTPQEMLSMSDGRSKWVELDALWVMLILANHTHR